jgi:hypothetical protein
MKQEQLDLVEGHLREIENLKLEQQQQLYLIKRLK